MNEPISNDFHDDDLKQFDAKGAAPLPKANQEGFAEHAGARIWYSTYGSGAPVILLHGGLGNSGNWGYQIQALTSAGRQVVLIDSRGHGRSTRDSKPYTYHLMASDVLQVMNTLKIERADFVGWSDGACTSMVLASQEPTRVGSVFFFGCNMDPSGAIDAALSNPLLGRCFSRHEKDYAALSPTPGQFMPFVEAVNLMMKTEPHYTPQELAEIQVRIAIVHSEFDEFIKREHAEYLAKTLPNAEFILLKGVSHFAPLQRPAYFNQVLIPFLLHH